MRRTGVADLLVPLVVIGALVYLLLRLQYDSIPPLQYVVAVPLAALAVVEFVVSRRVRAVVRHEPNSTPMTAIAIARCVALGKASSLVGAAVVGAGLAVLVRVAPDAGTVTAAANDTRVSVVLIIAAGLLVAAGLLLERAGIDPGSDEGAPRGASEAGR